MKKINLIEWLWKTDSHEKQMPQKFRRYAGMLIMLLTLGVGQMWAGQNINAAYLKASFNGSAVLWDGSSDEYVYSGSGHSNYDLGTLTGDFIITYVSWRAWTDWYNTTDFYLYYNTDGNGSSFPGSIKQNWSGGNGDYYPKTTSLSKKVASVTDGSGNYDFEHYFYADFGGYGGGNRSWLSNGGNNYHFTYTILPPNVSSFDVSTTGSSTILSGDGSEGNPYLISYNGSLKLTISGSKEHTDANSDAQYNTAGTWNTTTTRTISNITSGDIASVTVKMRYHNGTASLNGAESSKTIYYKAKAQGFESSLNGIKYVTTGDPVEWSFNGQSTQTRDLNTVTNLYLKQWFTYEYQNWDGCLGTTKFQYNIHRTAVAAGEYTDIANNWNEWDEWSSGWRHMKFGHNNQNVNLLAGLGSGKYTMSFRYNDPGLDITSPVHSLKWTIGVPSMATHVVTSNGTGTGASSTPFNMAVGSTLTITVSGTQLSSDANSVLYVSFDNGSTYSATTTKSISITNTTKYSVHIKAKYYNSDDDLSGSVYDFGDVYYQGTLTPSLAISSFTQDASTVTAANSGSTVTINASRQNAGTETITYAYSTDNSNWTTIASTSSTSQSWTLPAVTSTTTYYVKASMTYNSTPYSDTETFTVYGKKTIKVKDTNGWGANFKIHRWGGGSGTEYPGETANITSAGGQWKQIVLYSSNTDFLLCNGESGSTADGNKTADQTYASMADNGCYEIGNGPGSSLALTSTDNCPAKPTVSVVDASSVLNTTATINGSISNTGNDNMTDYGFYWSKDYSTAAALQSNGTKVQIGTSNYTGSITQNLTSLSAHTTYYYIVYATNGQGTQLSSVQSFTTKYKVTISKSTGCSSISPSGVQYTSGSINLTAVRTTGYTFSEWTKTNGNLTNAAVDGGTNTVTFTPTADNATITATYTENSYNVTLSSTSGGYTTPAEGTVSVKQVTGTSISATPNTNFVFVDWTISGGGITPTTSSTSPQNFKATTTGGTIRANFEDQWCLKGDQWSSWTQSKGLPNTGTNTFGNTFTLTKGQKYIFKVHDRKTNTWYGNADGGGEHAMERGASAFTTTAGGNNNNLTVTPDVTGDYTFSFNSSNRQLTVSYPEAYTVTFGAGTINGSDAAITASASPSFSSGDYVLPETDITFHKGSTKDGYTWKGWYSDQAGSATKHSSTDGDFTWSATRTGNISVYACYNFITYNITYHLNGGSGATDRTFNVETSTITLPTPTRTGYNFNGWYANSDLSTGGVKTQVVKGTHANQEFWAKWTPKNYTITLNCNGATSTTGVPASVTATYDAVAAPPDGGQFADLVGHHPSRTGYTFGGWYTNNDGTGTCIITSSDFYDWGTSYVDATGHWIHDGNIEVFAKWTPNPYTVDFDYDETGYGSAGGDVKTSVTATYDATMPSMGTAPTPAPGYKFQGYFTGHNGGGTQYYDASGNSVNNWNIADDTTLYAYFQKTVISSLEHPTAVAKGDVITVDVNPVFNQEDAQPNMAICWSLLYDTNDEVESGVAVASYPAEGKPNQVRFTLTGLSSGYYQIKAVLKANGSTPFSPCSAGTELSTIKSNITLAGNSKVTIQYEDASGNIIAPSSTLEVARGDELGIKAPNIIGYSFSKWILSDVLDSVCDNPAVCGSKRDSINITAAYDGVLIAQYTKKNVIYFNNTLGWEDVYVYFYNNNKYWDDSYGTGAYKGKYWNGTRPYYEVEHGHMTRIEGTTIWYFDYTAAGYTTHRSVVAFANMDKSYSDDDDTSDNDKGFFSNTTADPIQVIRRSDHNAALPMFVPLTGQATNLKNNNKANYVSNGYWMNYPENTGYTLKIYDNTGAGSLVKERDFEFPANKAMPMSITVDLEGGNKTYGFKIYRADGVWFRNGGTMTNGHSGDTGQAAWEFGTEDGSNCGLTTTSAGNYTFTIWVNSSANHQVGVHYPESTGDFRVMYTDDVRIANHDSNEGKSWLLSSVIPADTEHDTISYFVRAENSKHPKYKIQKCTITEAAREEDKEVRWADQGIAIDVPDSITENGVYNFIFAKNDGNLVLSKVEPYTGNFYIRVDGAGSSNWDNFRAADHLMSYSDYSFNQTNNPYSHYFMEWRKVTDRSHLPNVKFVVANDHSVCISDTIAQDGIANNYVDGNGYLNRDANIRFMYNYKTNEATRRYIDGAYAGGGDFLLILSDDSKLAVRNHDDTADSTISVLKFSDNGNWVYEANVRAIPQAQYKLKSTYGKPSSDKPDENGEVIQYFKGGDSSTETLIGGSGSGYYNIRLLYDFKTNRVVAAYQPSGTIDEDLAINADVMFMRDHQGDIEEITFATGKKITDIKNIYCGLRFNKWTLNNKERDYPHSTLGTLLSRYERDIFYVSFPYDVRLSDVIGFGTYGQHWIVEYYDGAARAKNGFWADTETFWRFVTPAMKDSYVLKAGVGYIVALDLDELYYTDATHHAAIWDNTDIQNLELLFPGDISSISDQTVTYTVPSHECTINRPTPKGDRTIKDSHWNVLGVPTFKNIEGAASGDGGGSAEGAIRFTNTSWIANLDDLKFIYTENLTDNSLTAKAVAGFEFKAMHSYITQYCGDVTFKTSATPAPSPIVARRTYAEQPRDVDFRLEINKNGVMEDQTFVSLSNDENVSADFAFGEDLSKEFNRNRANIYTFIGTEQAAGNTMPMSEQTTVVPVGVKIATTGDYTFAIPDGTSGVGVTLVDLETGVRTNLALFGYNINLEAGEYDERFLLEISPIQHISEGVDEVNGEGLEANGVRKVLIDNVLYIIRDGKVFDARGAKIK